MQHSGRAAQEHRRIDKGKLEGKYKDKAYITVYTGEKKSKENTRINARNPKG